MTRRPFDLSLYLVTDHRLPLERLLDVVCRAVAGGVTLVQLRNPDLGGRDLLAQALALKAALAGTGVPLIVNDRVDVARAAGAHGVHVGQSDLPAAAAREIMGEAAIVGLSITDPAQLADVDPSVVDYLGVGPVFATATKGNAAPALGLDGTEAIVRAAYLPSVAIGGIDATNAAAVMATGVRGISVVSAISTADDPQAAAATMAAVVAGR